MVAPGQERIQVLHVDDEPGITALSKEFLEREDERFVVETATSAAEGLRAVREASPDCVVSDYNMPGTDGVEFLSAVREENPDLPFILFTGQGSERVASDAISAGVTDYLQKTSGTEQFERLATRIGNAVERYHAERPGAREFERSSALFENMAEPIAYYEFEGEDPIVRAVNPAFEEVFGVTDRNARGAVLDDIVVPPTHTEEGEEINERVRAGEIVNTEVEREAADGLRTFTLLSVPVAPDGPGKRGYAVYTDITERKDRERELERYATIIEASGDPVYTLDAKGRFTFVNDALVEMTGYDDEDLLGHHFSAILVREDAERGGTVMRSLRDPDMDRRTTELTVVRPDGRRVPCEIHVTSLPTEDDPRGIVGVIRDITERKERERERQRQRDRYQSLFESTNDAVAWTEYDGETPIIREANPRFRDQFETQGEDVLGQPLTEVVTAPEHRDRVEEISRRVKEGVHQRGELQLDTVDGPRTFIWEAIPYTPPGANEVQNTHAIYTDITERKERERQVREQREQLARREEKLIRLRDYTQALMYAESPSETAHIALSAVDETLGFDLGAVFTQSETQDGLLELVEVLNRSRMEKMYGGLPTFLRNAPDGTHSDLAWEVFESGEPVFINDTAESTKLTRKSPFGSLMLYPIGRHGVVLLAATTLEAFTETEEILLDLLATALETAFDRLEREQDLRRQRDELERQNERLDEFVSVVSHDLRNPLNVASGRLELANDECDSDHLEGVAGALDRMRTLIDDLLALARDGDRISDLEPVAVADLGRACWETVATGDASLVVDTDITVRADRGRLQQLIENLIRNAVEHGGSDVTITIGTVDGGFFVADDGSGIDESVREKVFETGYSTTADNTGFGLNIVREIARAHGWDIDVTDSAHGGARFEITGVERLN